MADTPTTTEGTVVDLKVRQAGDLDFCSVTILDSTTQTQELFVLWFEFPDQLVPFPVWIERTLCVGLLRQALTDGLTVVITHDTSSSVVESVDLFAA